MKKFFVIIGIIFALLAIGAAVFVFTFDANRYKAALITKLEEALAKDAAIDSISISLLRGINIDAKGVAIKDKDKTWDYALFKTKSLTANVAILPLLRNEVQIQRIFIPELKLGQVRPAIEGMDIKAQFINNNLVIQKATGFIAGGKFTTTGIVRDLISAQNMELDIKTDNVSVMDFAPEAPKGSPVFRGGLDLDMRCSSSGFTPEAILKTFKGKGNAKLEKAVLENMNVLNAAMDQLNMLPGLVDKLKKSLPEKYAGLLSQNFTAFKPMNAGFEIKDGRILFDKLLVESDAFYLVARGSAGMDQSLEVSANLFIPKDLSGAFADSVPEFKYLMDDKGVITIPLEVRGKIPNITVMPNLNYIIQKLAISKGQELLDKLFK